MPEDASVGVLQRRLERAIERNARLVVVIRHLARDLHRAGLSRGGHSAVADWTRCQAAICIGLKNAIEANETLASFTLGS